MAGILSIACTLMGNPVSAQFDSDDPVPAYRDTSLGPEERAADLVARMTLDEKIPQLLNDAPAIPHLDIREYNWWSEGLHGVAAAGYATVFPQAIGMAATWDEALVHQIADVVSIEFRAKFLAERHRLGGSDWFGGLTVWSPNINIFRDPRWGRGQETYGEDPYLTARLGVAFVTGLQGDDPRYLRTVSTPKHYAVHSGPEPSRHRDDIHPSPHDLEDTYLPAFRATVIEGQAGSIMCAYNAIDGQPACANEKLLVRYLRQQWGFEGYVVSDCDAVGNIYRANQHGYTATPEEGVAVAFKTGMDLICGPSIEIGHIRDAVRQGLLSEATIDTALRRLFTARMRLGLFDPEGMVFPSITAADYDTDEHRALSLKAAEASLVLLRNEGGLLPLKSAPASIAVIGPNADSLDALVGNYNGDPSQPVTVLSGLRNRFPEARVVHVEGTGLIDPVLVAVPDAVLCVDADCRVGGLTAEQFDARDFSGEPSSTAVQANAANRWRGELRSGATRWTGYLQAPETGEYHFRFDGNGGYRIWVDDTPVVDAWQVDWRPSIAAGSITLEAGHRYALRVESFQRTREGDERLLWALPGEPAIKEAQAAAEQADLVVFAAGLSHRIEWSLSVRRRCWS
ncbi:MAG: glycoside hydrolase family 3 N-terminal domain-containing protein [Woeseiaceae bacterium]